METTYTVKESEVIKINRSDRIDLFLFGDIHRDAKGCDVGRWHEFLKEAKANLAENPHTYFIGMGDYNDFASSSEQKAIKNSGKIHETTMQTLDTTVQNNNILIASECSFMRGHLLGLLEGNHTWTLANSQTATQDLAERLDTICLGWLSHYTLKFNMCSWRMAIHMALCHGKAGGKTHGITINQVADLKQIFPTASIYAMGHDHQRGTWPTSALIPYDNGHGIKIRQLEQRLVRTGSFLRAYLPNTSSYEIGRLYRPANIGAVKIEIKIKKNDEHGLHYSISSRV